MEACIELAGLFEVVLKPASRKSNIKINTVQLKRSHDLRGRVTEVSLTVFSLPVASFETPLPFTLKCAVDLLFSEKVFQPL